MKRASGLILAAMAVAAVGGVSAARAKPHGDGDVPPGLAKKGGLPPGQAKKLYGRGEFLPRVYVAPTYYVREPVQYRLAPPPPGARWVIVDGNAYLVRTETGLIMDVVQSLLDRR